MAITLQQIADAVGVSKPTVSYALNDVPGQVSDTTRRRILEVAAEMGYRPNAAARSMRVRRTRNVGVVLHGPVCGPIREHNWDFVSGINAVLEPAGHTTCIVQMQDVESGPEGMSRVFREQALDGMIVVAALMPSVRDRIGGLVERVVWCDAGVRNKTDCLWRDEVRAGRLAAEALLGNGFRQLLYVGTDPQRRTYLHADERHAGASTAVRNAGGEMRFIHMPSGDCEAGDIHPVAADVLVGAGVLASEYWHVYVLTAMANALGLIPGRDFGLVCADETFSLAVHFPHIARASFDRFDLGRRAASMLLSKLRDPDAPCESHVAKPRWSPASLRTPGFEPPKSAG